MLAVTELRMLLLQEDCVTVRKVNCASHTFSEIGMAVLGMSGAIHDLFCLAQRVLSRSPR